MSEWNFERLSGDDALDVDELYGDISDNELDVDVQHYGDADEDEDQGEAEAKGDFRQYVVLDDDEENLASRAPPLQDADAFPDTIELDSLPIHCGTIRKGDTVELQDRTGRVAENRLLSGDFLRVQAIFENLETEEVKLQGYRLRRCGYLQPLFDRKLNEVFILVEANKDDQRPTLIQGVESVAISEVIKKRRCVFTKADYKAFDVRMANRYIPARLKTPQDVRDYIFKQGTLVCRHVHTVIFDHNGVSYSGEVRRLYQRETDQPSSSVPCTRPSSTSIGSSSSSSSSSQSTPKRCASVEQLNATPPKRRSSPTKVSRYTFGDAYCGAGGASEGASQADFFVKWGLEKDGLAMQAWVDNFPGGLPLPMDAHDFPAIARRCEHGVDLLHLSCPCCFWSEAHTNEGKNDQANMETLLTVGPFLKAVKPRYATLEQAPGLLKLRKHRLWFRKLINEIITNGYNVRWKVSDQSEYELAQRRRRLVFLCAKHSLPLPAFPKPTHGPKGSGLKYWVTVADALEPLERLGPNYAHNDPYHKPDQEKRISRPAVDPRTILAKCITTSGGENVHPSGTRRYTARETAQLQGFPLNYHFTGSKGEATKQAGNAWAPVANTKYFQLLAQFLEAFDLGFINAEDDIDNLWDHLENKGIQITELRTRYLKHLRKTVVSRKKHPLWGSTYRVEAAPRQRVKTVAQGSTNRRQRMVRDEAEVAGQRGEIIELD